MSGDGSAPLVSVLMSVYNGERYLREAVDSILAQTFGDFEFLIVDDGSTDGTAGILASCSDSRIRLIRNETNLGLTRSLNRGLTLARGKYIARQDADDVALPERLAVQVDHLEAHPEVIALGGRLCFIDSDGARIGEEARVVDHEDIVAQLMQGIGAVPHPAVVMRTDAVRQVGGYREEFRAAQDVDLWLRLAECGQLANLEQVIAYYRVHEEQVSIARRRLQRDAAERAVIEALRRQGSPIPSSIEIAGGEVPKRWQMHHRLAAMALHAGNPWAWWKHAILAIRYGLGSKLAWSRLGIAIHRFLQACHSRVHRRVLAAFRGQRKEVKEP
jgi:glycosyltransferase involved in cell wall biosynthesis